MERPPKKISGSVFFHKYLFPTIWFGFLGVMIVFMILPTSGGDASPMFIVLPLIMALFGYFMFRKLVWDLADEVLDAGDELIFRKGDKQQRVKLSDIINIGYSNMSSPERIVITSRTDGPIGKELVFTPPLRLITFSKNPIVGRLIERVDRARNSS